MAGELNPIFDNTLNPYPSVNTNVSIPDSLDTLGGTLSGLVNVEGNLTLNTSAHIKGGQTGYNTGTGFFLGYSSGYKFSLGNPSGDHLLWDGSALTLSGALNAGSINIPDEDTTANSFHVESDGDAWWGCTHTNFTANNDNATAYILKTGVARFASVTVVGGVIDGTSTIGGRIASTLATAIDSSGHFADSAISTAAGTILGEFVFSGSGAIQIGTYVNGVSGDLKLSPTGILARDSSGATTFSINGTTGVAVLNGLVVGTNVGLGTAQDSAGVTTIIGNTVTTSFVNALNVNAATVSASISITTPTITGGTIQTASSGNRVVMSGATNSLSFFVGAESTPRIFVGISESFSNNMHITNPTSSGKGALGITNDNGSAIDIASTTNGGYSLGINHLNANVVMTCDYATDSDIVGNGFAYELKKTGTGAGDNLYLYNAGAGTALTVGLGDVFLGGQRLRGLKISSGAPSTADCGNYGIVYDTTNNRLYFNNNGTLKYVAFT